MTVALETSKPPRASFEGNSWISSTIADELAPAGGKILRRTRPALRKAVTSLVAGSADKAALRAAVKALSSLGGGTLVGWLMRRLVELLVQAPIRLALIAKTYAPPGLAGGRDGGGGDGGGGAQGG